MDLIITLTCEYIFDEQECITYLTSILIDPSLYEYVYKEYHIDEVKHKKKVRKLINVKDLNLTEYKNTVSIKFDHKFNQSIRFPNNVTHLTFGCKFNQCLQLSNSITHITFDYAFDQPIMYLPCRLIYLKLGFSFNHKLPKLPKTLTELHLGEEFNQEILHFPARLRVLNTNDKYNHKLPSLSNLTHLTIQNRANCDILFPSTLTHLEWNCGDHISSLPHKLTHLMIFKYQYKHHLPLSIRHLTINMYDIEYKFIDLPRNLKYLYISVYDATNKDDVYNDFSRKINKLPDTLTHLDWEYYFTSSNPIQVPKLPLGLKYLRIKYYQEHEIGHSHKLPDLPSKLIYLNIGDNFNQILPKPPSTLKHLELGNNFNHALPELPSTLKHLELGDNFNHVLPKLPLELEVLILGNQFNHEIPHLSKLKHLDLGKHFIHKLPILSNILEYLCIGENFTDTHIVLPETLRELRWFCNIVLPILPSKLNILLLGWDFHQKLDTESYIREIRVYKHYKYLDELQQTYGEHILYMDDE
jgi:hypothetical protein